MNKKNLVVLIFVFSILIISMSFVSAGFFGDLWAKITGKAVSCDSCVGGFTDRYDCSAVVESGAYHTGRSYQDLCTEESESTSKYCYWDSSETGSEACKERPCDSYTTEEECPVDYGCEWEEAQKCTTYRYDPNSNTCSETTLNCGEETSYDYMTLSVCEANIVEEKKEKSAIIPKELPEGSWTEWYNTDNPGDGGDFESLSHIRDSLFYDNPCGGDNPLYIECKTISGEDYTETGEDVTCSLEEGFKCRNSDNPEGCSDYQIRFYCKTKIVEEKSTTTSSDKCTDSDGGENLLEKGTRTSPEGTYSDVCRNSKAIAHGVQDVEEGPYLLELFCEGDNIDSRFYNCSEEFGEGYVCKDGACVEEKSVDDCSLLTEEIKQKVAELQNKRKKVVLKEGEKIGLGESFLFYTGSSMQLFEFLGYSESTDKYSDDEILFKNVLTGGSYKLRVPPEGGKGVLSFSDSDPWKYCDVNYTGEIEYLGGINCKDDGVIRDFSDCANFNCPIGNMGVVSPYLPLEMEIGDSVTFNLSLKIGRETDLPVSVSIDEGQEITSISQNEFSECGNYDFPVTVNVPNQEALLGGSGNVTISFSTRSSRIKKTFPVIIVEGTSDTSTTNVCDPSAQECGGCEDLFNVETGDFAIDNEESNSCMRVLNSNIVLENGDDVDFDIRSYSKGSSGESLLKFIQNKNSLSNVPYDENILMISNIGDSVDDTYMWCPSYGMLGKSVDISECICFSDTKAENYPGMSCDSLKESAVEKAINFSNEFFSGISSTKSAKSQITSQCSEDGQCSVYLNENVTYEGYNISLISVSDDSAEFLIADNSKKINKGASKVIGELSFYLKSIEEINGRSYVRFAVSVLNIPNAKCSGCKLNEKCYVIGHRTSNEYCSESGDILTQKERGLSCVQNYECDSNICIKGSCIGLSLWDKILSFFGLLDLFDDCSSEDDCGRRYTCSNDRCLLKTGESCDYDSMCASGYCNQTSENCEQYSFSFSTVSS